MSFKRLYFQNSLEKYSEVWSLGGSSVGTLGRKPPLRDSLEKY